MKATTKDKLVLSETARNWLVIISVSIAFSSFVFAASKTKPEYHPEVMFYNSTGQIGKPGKIWMQTVTITDGSSQTVDISSAGFTSIATVNITGANNTNTLTAQPLCMEKSHTLTSLVFNTETGNASVLAILAGTQTPASTTGMTASIVIIGN